MTAVEQLVEFYQQLNACQRCGLHKSSWLHAMDWNGLEVLTRVQSVPFVLVGQAPAYCEDRAAVPFVGGNELLTSRCGWCPHMPKTCFPYFLHQQESYKTDESPCQFARNEGVSPLVSEKAYATRLKKVPRDFRYKGDTFLPSTAGELLDYMLEEAGINRPSFAQVQLDRAFYVDGTEIVPPAVHCLTINTVQCRSCQTTNGVVQNRPPTQEERDACSPWVHRFITILRPKAVLAFGLDAIKTLVDPYAKAMRDYIGKQLTLADDRTTPVWAFYHPSYHLHRLTGVVTDDAPVMAAIQHEIALLQNLKAQYS